MHEVDDVERLDVGRSEPVHHLVEAFHEIVELEVVAGEGIAGWGDLFAALFILTAVDGVEHGLGEICASAEELHLLADAHGGDTAGDAVVVSPVWAHEVVVLVLDRAGLDGDLGAEVFEALWEFLLTRAR